MATVALQAAGGFGAGATANLGYVPPVIESAEVINNEHTGTAQAGAAGSITLAAGGSATTDFYKGAIVETLTGTGAGQLRKITAYNGTTKAATTSPNWDTNPDNTTTYKVHSGTHIALTFGEAVSYSAGSATIYATPILGQTAQREILTTGSPVRGDGTTTLVFKLRDSEAGSGAGKPVCYGETGVTVDIPDDFVSTVSHSQLSDAQTDIAVTNNSQWDYPPHVGQASGVTAYITDGLYTIEADAFAGFSNSAGDGLTSVTYAVSDGSNPDVTGTMSRRTAYDGYNLYGATADINSLDDGALTVTVTATSNSGLGARSISWTIYNNTGGTLDVSTLYIATTGDDTTGNGTTGTPYLTIGKCIDVARVAARDGLIINVKDAGTRAPKTGGSGNSWANTYPIVIQPDPAAGLAQSAVVLTSAAAASGIRTYATGPHIARNLTFNCTTSDNLENINQTYFKFIYNCRLTTNDDNYLLVPSGLTTLFPSGAVQLTDCTIDKVLTCINGNVAMARNCLFSNFMGDAITSFGGSIINCEVQNRGLGAVAFTCQYSGSGTGTIAKTGNHSAGSFVLVDTDNGTSTFDLTNASYDTIAELVAAIDAVPGWAATLVDGSRDSDNMFAFSAVDAKTTLKSVYGHSGFHSDNLQLFDSTIRTNYMVSGLRTTAVLGEEYLGLEADKQVFWFDHAGPLNVDGLAVVNIADPTFAATNVTRSSFHGYLRNVFFGFNTYPFSKHNLVYAGGGTANSHFSPGNFIYAYNVCDSLNHESGGGGSGTGADVYVVDNHFDSAGTVVGTDYTTGAVEDEFASLTSSTSYDLTPASDGQLVSRVPRATFADIDGDDRETNGAIGSYAAAADGPSPSVPSGGFRSRSRGRGR